MVSCIRAGSIADRSDAIQVGDLLVGVNGLRVTELTHQQILTLLRNAGDQVTLTPASFSLFAWLDLCDIFLSFSSE